ncbi:hypothetical protein GCM10028801_36770 [Nocardioides maradonensis]
MARRVVLHVGTMKSGTSYVQAALFAQHARLAEAGVLVPGRRWSDQSDAVHDLVSSGPGDRWAALTASVAEHPGDAVISMEYLGPIREATADRVLEAFGAERVEVVITARDLNRTLVSMWQETIQNGRSWTWVDYRADAEAAAPGSGGVPPEATRAGRSFWRQQHLARIVDAWVRRVGADRVTLVTLPHPGAPAGVLAERFVDATSLPLDPSLPVPRRNESLGLASTLVLRDLNAALDADGLGFPAGQRLRKFLIAKKTLSALAGDEPRLGLAVDDWVRAQTEATVARVRASGVRVAGDLADLTPVDVPGVEPADVDPALLARASAAALTMAVAEHIRATAR